MAPPLAQSRVTAPLTEPGGNVRTSHRTTMPVAQIPATTTSAQSTLRDILDQWGLAGLADWAWQKIVAGASLDQVIYEMRQTPEYKKRFAGNVVRQDAGLAPMTETEYLQYEQSARQVMAYYGLPQGFYDQPDDFAAFIGKDVSVSELHDRVQQAVTLAQADITSQGEYGRLYGVGPNGAPVSYSVGDVAAYMLDQTRALPLLQRQVQAGTIAGAAKRTGFGEIDRIAAEHLAALGVTDTQAVAGFGQLAGLGEVTGTIIGDTGPGLSKQDQISAVFEENAAAAEELSRRKRARVAGYKGSGGSYAETQRGG